MAKKKSNGKQNKKKVGGELKVGDKERSNEETNVHEPKEEGEEVAANTAEGSKEEGEEGIWDIVRIITKDKEGNKNEAVDDEPKLLCRTEECKRQAVSVWAVDTNPTDEWPICEECQEKEFGGYPEGLNPNATVRITSEEVIAGDATEKEKDAEINDHDSSTLRDQQHEEAVEDTSDLDTKSSIKEVIDDISKERNGTNGCQSKSNGADSKSLDGNDDDALEETWELTKIMSVEDLTNGRPTKCSTDKCKMIAACVYVSNNAQKDKWYTCLDCQVSWNASTGSRLAPSCSPNSLHI